MTDYTNPSVYGVVVVVYCTTTKRFYILRELKDKPVVYKKAGMLAFVSETSMPHDKDVLATSHRAVDEEVGSGIINDDDIFVREKPVEGLPHSVPVYAAWVTVDEEFCETNSDDDVEYHGWLSEDDLRLQARLVDSVRVETLPVLEVFLRGRGGANV